MLLSHIHVNVDFIFLFFRIDLFRVIDIDGEVEWLIFDFFPLHISGL